MSAAAPLEGIAPAALAVDRFIDRQPFGRSHATIVALCALAAAIDGFDAQLITYLAPSIVHDLDLPRPALGPIFSAGIVGMALGSFIGGPLADRFGRKPVIVLSLLWFGLFSTLTAASASVEMLIALRLAAGLGFGAVMPNAAALVAEFAPGRYRATMVMVMYCGFPVGGAVAGPVTAALLRTHEWRFLFILGGGAALAIALLQLFLLPESLRFLVETHRSRRAVARSMRFVEPAYRLEPTIALTVDRPAEGRARPVVQLFAEGRGRVTILLWAIFLFASIPLYVLVTWLPVILQDHGVQARDALLVTSMFQLGGLVFSLSLGRVIDRTAPAFTFALIFAMGGICTFLIGSAGTSPALLGIVIFLTGGFVQGGLTGLTAVSAGFYPTIMRSTGVGWALGISRIGGVIGPMLGALAVSAGLSLVAMFGLTAVPIAAAAFAALALSLAASRKPERI
jgi:AAHS family 4-hydroxybenzoate transporter-like MFS transporter